MVLQEPPRAEAREAGHRQPRPAGIPAAPARVGSVCALPCAPGRPAPPAPSRARPGHTHTHRHIYTHTHTALRAGSYTQITSETATHLRHSRCTSLALRRCVPHLKNIIPHHITHSTLIYFFSQGSIFTAKKTIPKQGPQTNLK